MPEEATAILPSEMETSIANAVDASIAAKVDKADEEPKPVVPKEPKLPAPKADEPKPKPKEDVSPVAEDEGEIEGDPNDGKPEPLTDELLERAVKAGMSMKNARKFPDAESLTEALAVLGGDEGSGESDEVKPTGEKKSAIDAALDAIPDLDPEEYDESLVGSIKSLKELVRQQSKQIEALSQSKSGTWMEEQINTLGDVAKTVRDNPDKKSALLKKFAVLKAGYNATNESVPEEEIFQEAAEMTLGDELSKAADRGKSSAAQKRSAQRIARPSSQPIEPTKSVEQETAEMLREKFKTQ
jgi:hypothetical protein